MTRSEIDQAKQDIIRVSEIIVRLAAVPPENNLIPSARAHLMQARGELIMDLAQRSTEGKTVLVAGSFS